MADDTAPAQTPPPENTEPPKPAIDPAALQAELAQTKEQLKQLVATLATQQPPVNEPPPPPVAVAPELREMFQALVQQELGPALRDMRQQLEQQSGWQRGQQLSHLASELELPEDLQTAARNMMAQYAQAGRPIPHQVAVRQVLGEREENRLRQEAATKRSKQQFNAALMPTFAGAGGLPSLTPANGAPKPKDNDILGWAKLAREGNFKL